MLSHEDNERITRVGPETPMGEVFRRYWIPALLDRELTEPDGDPVRVRLLGEDLVAFRDTNGEIGLIDAYCPHRRAPMFFGRNENCGLTCVYHGWKFDANGKCLQTPNEPADSSFCDKVSIKSYPTCEVGGIIWTYMGPDDEKPDEPDYEWCRVPDSHRFVTKTLEECNYLQAIEGGIDTAHSSFAHNNNLQDSNALRNRSTNPKLEVDKTPYGFRYVGVRDLKEDGDYVRVYHFMMPFQQVRGSIQPPRGVMNSDDHIPTINGHLWVPIDDETCYVYNWLYASDESTPIPIEFSLDMEGRFGRGVHDNLPGYPPYRLKQNSKNDYKINRDAQRTMTFTGVRGVNTQDFVLQEGMGPICDRTKEKLCSTDIAIITCRQLMFEAIKNAENKKELRGSNADTYRNVRGTDSILPKGLDWKAELKEELKAKW